MYLRVDYYIGIYYIGIYYIGIYYIDIYYIGIYYIGIDVCEIPLDLAHPLYSHGFKASIDKYRQSHQ